MNEPSPWILFSGIGTLLLSFFGKKLLSIFFPVKKTKTKPQKTIINQETKEETTNSANRTEDRISYKVRLGETHEWLRENILKLTPREMTEFYGFESVTQLEKYEQGIHELPLHELRRLEEFFFLNPNYLGTGQGSIFQNFYNERSEISKYLNDGFTPTIACCPDKDDPLLGYVVLHKKENDILRVITANNPGSFESSVGRNEKVHNLICEMIDRGKDSHYVNILNATPSDWKAIEENRYYDYCVFSRSGARLGIARKYRDIFDEWYEDVKKNHVKWNP